MCHNYDKIVAPNRKQEGFMKIVMPGNDKEFFKIEKEQFCHMIVSGAGTNRYWMFPKVDIAYEGFCSDFYTIVDNCKFNIPTNDKGQYVVGNHWLWNERIAKMIALRYFLASASDAEVDADMLKGIMEMIQSDGLTIEV